MKYQLRQQLFAIGDDYWIESDDGGRAFKVDGKALRIRKTLVLAMDITVPDSVLCFACGLIRWSGGTTTVRAVQGRPDPPPRRRRRARKPKVPH